MTNFAEVSRVAQIAPGRFTADVHPDWTIGGKPNGGYLLAMLGRAAVEVAGRPDPVATSAHYLRSPDAGPVEIEAELRRGGRSASQVRATLIQDGIPRVDALFTVSDFGTADADVAWSAIFPEEEIAPLEDCERVVGVMEQLAIYLDPATAGFTTGQPTGRGELRGWLSLPGDEAFDTVSLLLAVDAFPPSSWDVAFTGWVPTLELTAYARARPAPGPVRVRVRAELISHGRVDETCHIWDSRGTLVAQASQLAGIRFPT